MANEIKIVTTLSYAKGTSKASLGTTFSASQTGVNYEAGIQLITTSESSLQKNAIGTIGYLALKNLDTVNFIQLGATTGVYSIKLLAGEGTITPWKATNTYVLANTASCEVEYLLIEA